MEPIDCAATGRRSQTMCGLIFPTPAVRGGYRQTAGDARGVIVSVLLSSAILYESHRHGDYARRAGLEIDRLAGRSRRRSQDRG